CTRYCLFLPIRVLWLLHLKAISRLSQSDIVDTIRGSWQRKSSLLFLRRPEQGNVARLLVPIASSKRDGSFFQAPPPATGSRDAWARGCPSARGRGRQRAGCPGKASRVTPPSICFRSIFLPPAMLMP